MGSRREYRGKLLYLYWVLFIRQRKKEKDDCQAAETASAIVDVRLRAHQLVRPSLRSVRGGSSSVQVTKPPATSTPPNEHRFDGVRLGGVFLYSQSNQKPDKLNQVKTTAYYIKVTILSALLLVESFFLTTLSLAFVNSLNFIAPPIETFIQLGLLTLALIYTYALTLGAWDKWLQYVIIPVPIALGIFITLVQLDIMYAGLVSLLAALILVYDIYQSSKIMHLLIKFDPSIILRLSAKGILFVFSILAAVMLFLATTYGTQKIDLVAELKTQINSLVTAQTELLLKSNLGFANLGDLTAVGIDPQKIISGKVDELINNYKNFVTPIMMLLIFGVYQFIFSIVFLWFSLTIGPIFFIAKKLKFFTIEEVQITKEILRF